MNNIERINQNAFFKVMGCLWCLVFLVCAPSAWAAGEGGKKVARDYVTAPNAPESQDLQAVDDKSLGCMSCHTVMKSKSMHVSGAVNLGCVDCHGGDASVFRPDDMAQDLGSLELKDSPYRKLMEAAHVLPSYPEDWNYPSSSNPERTYTLLNRESPEFIRFMNPSDYRVVDESCGACHAEIIEAAKRSMHSTGAMLWGGAAYNNGILNNKNYALGEAYSREGEATSIKGPWIPESAREDAKQSGIIDELFPLPAWETVMPGDIFRVFERGGRNITNLFPETGLPNSLGQLQRIEEPGRPDFRQSNRGPGTGARIAVPLINITKTRLNDPLSWFMGTNDQPGDYRQSGCAGCHVVYANDRDPRHSGPYAKHGHSGQSQNPDPTISKEDEGHPLQHAFTRAIPTSQCMVCHMHQPNMFMNTYLGYTMWDYESDAPFMWPKEQVYPEKSVYAQPPKDEASPDKDAEKKPAKHEQNRDVLDRNPEGASVRGKWADVEFLKDVWENNDKLNDTQFADYHGHGWNFRAVFKRDRKGNLLDAEGNIVTEEGAKKFEKAVHMSSVHVDVGMHCVDCHFGQDSHGNGHLYGEVALAVEIDCKDCHGTADSYPTLKTSGPAAIGQGADLSLLRTPDGRKRFEWRDGKLYQRSSLDPTLEWALSLVKDTVKEGHPTYNEKAARAKLMSKNTQTQTWGSSVCEEERAHSNEEMECYACHTSWTTTCGGCHLPIEANHKTTRHHYEGGETRNYASYNPQVARDQMFALGRRGPAKGGKIAPVRSSSALVLSSTNANREKIYIQQPPIAASGYSSQAFNPHFPHTVRKTETKTCEDCHLSDSNDNNAIMAQLLLHGTDFIDFLGFNAWVGGAGELTAVQVTEWDEPQAVIGSYLHEYAYPDYFNAHKEKDRVLQNAHRHSAGEVGCLQLRGEYLFAAGGKKGVQVYDVAGIANKGISQRIITAPFSPLGHDAHIASSDATCLALPTTQPIHPPRNEGELMRVDNQEQPFHPLYNYMFVVDAQEGLIVVDINTFADGEPRNNFIKRALTWNPSDVLKGAKHITVGGHYLYVAAEQGVVIIDIDQPLKPEVAAIVPMKGVQATALQFRYLMVTDVDGLKAIDVTNPASPKLVSGNTIPMKRAYKMHLARTFAYVAAGEEGLVIVDITNPAKMVEYQRTTIEGQITDARDVVVATTNASLMGYIADGAGGLKVIQLTSPSSQPNFYGYSPDPKPQFVASYPTAKRALSLSRPLERDRAVDETGGQIAVFGRRGSQPLSLSDQQKLYLNNGQPWTVTNTPTSNYQSGTECRVSE